MLDTYCDRAIMIDTKGGKMPKRRKRIETKFKVGDRVRHDLFPVDWVGTVTKYFSKTAGICQVKWPRDGSYDKVADEDLTRA